MTKTLSKLTPHARGKARTVMSTMGPYCSPATLAKRDGRTREGRLMRDMRAELTAHLGGSPSATQSRMVNLAVEINLRLAVMDRRFGADGTITEHDSRTYLAWAGKLARLLRDLGMRGAAQHPPTLADIDWSVGRTTGAAAWPPRHPLASPGRMCAAGYLVASFVP